MPARDSVLILPEKSRVPDLTNPAGIDWRSIALDCADDVSIRMLAEPSLVTLKSCSTSALYAKISHPPLSLDLDMSASNPALMSSAANIGGLTTMSKVAR